MSKLYILSPFVCPFGLKNVVSTQINYVFWPISISHLSLLNSKSLTRNINSCVHEYLLSKKGHFIFTHVTIIYASTAYIRINSIGKKMFSVHDHLRLLYCASQINISTPFLVIVKNYVHEYSFPKEVIHKAAFRNRNIKQLNKT